MPCKFCGETNPSDANFCGNCGKALRETPLPSRPRKRRIGVKGAITILFLLTLATYLSYLIFEPFSFEYEKGAQLLKMKIESLKENSNGKVIDFQLVLRPQEIDGYLNEEFFKKRDTGFKAIHTRLLNEEMEVALSTNFFYIPTSFRIRLRPEGTRGDVTLSTRGMSLGRVPIPSFLYQSFYQRHPYLDPDCLMREAGIKFKEIRVEIDRIFLKGTWSI